MHAQIHGSAVVSRPLDKISYRNSYRRSVSRLTAVGMERSDRFVEHGRGLAVVVSRLEELGFPGMTRRALLRCADLRQVREVAAKARVRPWDLPEDLQEAVCGDQTHALSAACPCDSFARLWSEDAREKDPARRAHRFLERQVCPVVLERLSASMGVPQFVARDARAPTAVLCRRVLRHPAAAGASVEALRQHLRRIDLSFSERLDNPAARGGGWQAAEQPGIGRRAEKVPRFTPCTYAARQEILTPRAARVPVGPSPSAPPWRSSAEIPGPFIPECPQKTSAQPFSD
ncbi:uncharacterized protein [Penaeus vannamei]|uniref:uncharacterized protein isoform X2 n=1 Tax=Penaeus vannamei TaxID=6689 RepID=UPI00387FA344